jgi:hypothetical protein
MIFFKFLQSGDRRAQWGDILDQEILEDLDEWWEGLLGLEDNCSHVAGFLIETAKDREDYVAFPPHKWGG